MKIRREIHPYSLNLTERKKVGAGFCNILHLISMENPFYDFADTEPVCLKSDPVNASASHSDWEQILNYHPIN